MVINASLLHTALNLDSADYGVVIAPEFRIDDTRLEPTGYTYGQLYDNLHWQVYKRCVWYSHFALSFSNIFLTLSQSPKFAFLSDAILKPLSCSIYAKADFHLGRHSLAKGNREL